MQSQISSRCIRRKLCAVPIAALVLATGAGHAAQAQTPTSELMTRVGLAYSQSAVAHLVSGARYLGHQSPATPVQLAISLPIQNQTEFNLLLHQMYDPHSPEYHHYLKRGELASRFGASMANYNTVKSFVEQSGMTIVDTSAAHDLILVSGPTATVEKDFGVRFSRYLMPDGRTVYAADSQPTIPKYVADCVSDIVGFTSVARRESPIHVLDKKTEALRSILGPQSIGNGPAGGLTPTDIKTAYSLSTAQEGNAQTVAIYELDGFNMNDVQGFASQYGFSTNNITTEPVDGFPGSPQDLGAEREVLLDIDMVLAMAPNANIIVYETFNSSADALDEYRQIQEDDTAQVVSSSWLLSEDVMTAAEPGTATIENGIFQKMASQGQSVFAASGDYGSEGDLQFVSSTAQGKPSVDDPASQPFVTGVGGTTLALNSDGTYSGEVVWNKFAAGEGASGGGVSTVWPKPTATTDNYTQVGAKQAVIPPNREVPDVALDGDPTTGYDIYFLEDLGNDPQNVNGWETIGGTSAAAPLWAGFTALVNEQLGSMGENALGEANVALYAAAGGTTTGTGPTPFHDIISGNNGVNGNAGFTAEANFDDCTGWGSLNGDTMLAQLAPPGSTISVTGQVVDTNGNPITNATVSLTVANSGIPGPSATTDGFGNFTLTPFAKVSYLITANASGFVEYAPSTAVTFTAGQTLLISLQASHIFPAGLQMISAPFEFGGIADFAQLFGSNDDPPSSVNNDPLLFYYNNASNQYLSPPTAPADTLHIGLGYWAFLPANYTVNGVFGPATWYLHQTGTPAGSSQVSIPLRHGWNMIGDPFTVSLTIGTMSAAVTSNGQTIVTPITDKASPVSLPLYTYPAGATAYVTKGAVDSLSPYVGYWIFAFQPCTLIITS